MSLCGIIAEYNPFHNGHLLHLRRALELGPVAVAMSGPFAQRGEPAVCSKHARAEMALRAGAALVVELPVCRALSGAEYFAAGGVALLTACGAAALCFGAEADDLALLQAAAGEAEGGGLKAALARGMSYPAALEAAYTPQAAALRRRPNNLLAVEYLRAISAQQSPMRPVAVKRQGAAHNDAAMCEAPSASAIRAALLRGDESACAAMPAEAAAILRRELPRGLPDTDQFYGAILRYISVTRGAGDIARGLGSAEGLENRFISAARERGGLSAIAMAMKTKRYTLARIRRALFRLILSPNGEDFNRLCLGADYIRVLGFRRDAQSVVSRLADAAPVPVLINLKRDEARLGAAAGAALAADIRANELWQAARGGKAVSEYAMPPVIV